MNRRDFFKTLGAVATVASLPINWLKKRFKLHGDGVTDETEAIQALLDGEAVEMPDGSIQQGGVIHFPEGTYKITNTVTISKPNTIIQGGHFDCRDMPEYEPVFRVETTDTNMNGQFFRA